MKNKVTFSENGTVIKEFLTLKGYKKELSVLKKMNCNLAPKIIRTEKGIIEMSFISGVSLIDKLIDLEKNGECPAPTASALAEFFKVFHSLNKYKSLGDLNFHNFIATENGEIFGIDYEEVTVGSIYSTTARALAFLYSYNDLSDTTKETFSQTLLSELKIPPHRIITRIFRHIIFLKKRRG
ncbi:MAG: hypothetical protein FWD49_00765 [Firmicutes bacterium]|nr:hypothetical protein [Bacillota bacterium]